MMSEDFVPYNPNDCTKCTHVVVCRHYKSLEFMTNDYMSFNNPKELLDKLASCCLHFKRKV